MTEPCAAVPVFFDATRRISDGRRDEITTRYRYRSKSIERSGGLICWRLGPAEIRYITGTRYRPTIDRGPKNNVSKMSSIQFTPPDTTRHSSTAGLGHVGRCENLLHGA